MVGVTVVSSLTDYRRMINHNLKEREKFDTDTAQQNVAIRYLVPPVPTTDREGLLLKSTTISFAYKRSLQVKNSHTVYNVDDRPCYVSDVK